MADAEVSGSQSDLPPTYNTVTAEDVFVNRPTLKEDGRIDVDLDSRMVKSLSLFFFNSKTGHIHEPGESALTPAAQSYAAPREPDPKPFPIKLNIVIQVVGSRGDVQPFIALGTGLQKHGHRVRLATHNVFDSFVRAAGLEFYPIGGDPAELMAYMVRNPGLIPSMKIPFVADAIIANPPSFAHLHCAQVLGIPVHMMFTMPWTSTRAFPHPLANIKFGHGSSTEPMTANFLSYAVVEFLTWQGLGDVINEWRESIHLEPIAFSDGPCLAENLKIPFTYCWSPALVPKPVDWEKHIDVCGFFFRQPPDYAPPSELEQFLHSGPPPIYIGFGSIVIDEPEKVSAMLLEAVRITGTRALISRGWSNLDGPENELVMYLGDCPHEWLFQHVAAVIHHGGAGTTACGLLNGRPTAIVPFFGDQPFWGNMVAAAGAGPKPIPQKSLSVENLVEAIRYCLKSEAAEAAQAIAAKMKVESGVEAAVASFHANLPRKELECDVIKGQPATWIYRGGGVRLRLSKLAAEILSSHLKVDFRRLQMHESRRTIIETRRWDPVTGTVSAAMGVSANLIKAAADIIVKPSTTKLVTVPVLTPSGSPLSSQRKKTSRGCMDATTAVTAASAAGVGNFMRHYASGLVIIPFAFTEGFRAVPRLYGEQVRDYGEIHDWKSGTVVGAKAVVFGVVDGVGGLFILPYKGAQEQGAIGAVKGVGKAIVGLSSNLFTATMGMATYPLQGIYKSIWTAANSSRDSLKLARRLEGRYLADKCRWKGADDKVVMDIFDALKGGKLPT
ncbi:Glycosyltransferase family 1 protein [Pleurostoma richardsiae]|uniref:Glycosyltransferase family 1 protein n=1 Tax=Pleurostoma richardsiae TaxID=41990 RepID=A0AA38R3B9_9PEZI|nr:Glycosyltransferase family 1 protein [Pleurostoma richardsiae]